MHEERKPKMSIDEIEAVALELPQEERAELIDRLIAGLADEEGRDPQWMAELNRRIDAVEAGATGVPAEEVFARMRARRDAGSIPR
jgi:putative addiction module component (TIGR02574 family)